MRAKLSVLTALFSIAACEEGRIQNPPAPAKPIVSAADPEAPGKKEVQPALPAEEAPAASRRLDVLPPLEKLENSVKTYFEGAVGRRVYVQVDKPLYRPGESIWIKSWDLQARDLAGAKASPGHRYELINPKGAIAMTKMVLAMNGTATNDFELPEEIEGDEYKIRVTTMDGISSERPIIVNKYETPRLQKKLEFVKKAYGPGDEVTATISVKRATGEPLANHSLRGMVWLDGESLEPIKTDTNAEGGALIRFVLPAKIERGDGLLNVLVDDSGLTESINKRVPIVLKKVQLSFYPEGGHLVTGLSSRLYFDAKNTLNKPADIQGRIVDDHGNTVATFATYHHGLGRIDFTPSTGRKYHAEITRPAGVSERYALPIALDEGCVLRTYDDLDGELSAIRASVRCSSPRKVIVAAVLRDQLLDAAAVEASDEAIVHLEPEDEALQSAQGIARITVFAEDLTPLAERIVYRNRRSGLQVKLAAAKKSYAPRDQVELAIETLDEHGKPVAAELALSVVDDTVITYADDKTGHFLSRLFLEPEIPDTVEEPNIYFDLTEKKSALAMDLLMGTRGWRRFDWQPVLNPVRRVSGIFAAESATRAGQERPRALEQLRGAIEKPKDAKPAVKKAPEPPPPAVQPEAAAPAQKAKKEPMRDVLAAMEAPAMEEEDRAGADLDDARVNLGGARRARGPRNAAGWAPVRIFPAPIHNEDGVRTDFRDTIYWAPNIRTAADGKTKVTFTLSDAVTSFRMIAEGVGSGRAGRIEETVRSSLPFSMEVKFPLEVSAGDKLLIPLTLRNERDRALQVKLDANFGEFLQLDESLAFSEGEIGAGENRSLYYPLTVADKSGKSKVSFAADASGLKDEFIRELTVVQRGFPQNYSASGELKVSATHTFDLGEAIPGSAEVSVKLYPSPLSTLISGLDGMLREPSGCFEQTSSTNYPNVMVLQYLKSHGVADAELLSKATGLAERGYSRLTGFETAQKGYEWFGQTPAHEALTAYGLVEFVDMAQVMGGVDQAMLDRTAAFIKSRRDGKGGFLRDSKALDSFGAASPEVTNAYITWSLTEAGYKDFDKEIAAQAAAARETEDAYLLALAANTLLNVRHDAAKSAVDKLISLRDKNGAWSKANHSITRSSGENLTIETTSLAVLALLKSGGKEAQVRDAVAWLNSHRGGYGQWGATQATVLALKAMTEHAKSARKISGSGTITVFVNGERAGEVSYAAGRRDPIVLENLGKYFKAGKNELRIETSGKDELPYTVAADFRTVKPASAADVVVDLEIKLAADTLKMGETVRLTAILKNKTAEGQPMTLARIGLPGGLVPQTWQLKELREKGEIAFWETRGREVILYFRDLAPNARKELALDLTASIPGEYTGPASSAYLYYTNDKKVWTDGLTVKITR